MAVLGLVIFKIRNIAICIAFNECRKIPYFNDHACLIIGMIRGQEVFIMKESMKLR